VRRGAATDTGVKGALPLTQSDHFERGIEGGYESRIAEEVCVAPGGEGKAVGGLLRSYGLWAKLGRDKERRFSKLTRSKKAAIDWKSYPAKIARTHNRQVTKNDTPEKDKPEKACRRGHNNEGSLI